MNVFTSPRLEVRDPFGCRTISIEKELFTIGRRTANDLCLTAPDVSKDHAEVAREHEHFVLKDRGSRFGTFVNGARRMVHVLRHEDRITLGRSGGTELIFLTGDERVDTRSAISGDLGQIAQLFDALRAIGSERVVDEVLVLVLDLAIDLTGAERAFIMLGNEAGALEMKAARAVGKVALAMTDVAVGRKIPQQVFATGREEVICDLAASDVTNEHQATIALGIRNVLCTPLRLVQYVNRDDASPPQRNIGVLYLDGQQPGRFLSQASRGALESLAREAAGAIENARLYHEALEKARVDQELRVAAEIQQALLPPPRRGRFFEVHGTSVPCRAVGGDFFDYMNLPGGAFGFTLGDVAGKGPPAALLTAVLQGTVSALATVTADVCDMTARANETLFARGIESKFATAFFGSLAPDGRLTYCNAGHNPPFLLSTRGPRRLETGGTVLGLFPGAVYEQESVQLAPGDTVVLFSDGVSDAVSACGEEFGDERIREVAQSHASESPERVTEVLVEAVRNFTRGACQHDDITVVVVRYGV